MNRAFFRLGGAALAASFLLVGLGSAGVWDPVELGSAELGRRVSLHVFGARGLELAGQNNRMPSLDELGRGELPIDLAAFGFRCFGLSEWAGRLPIAVFALLGVAALWALLARLANSRVAMIGSLVLSSSPLFFVGARSLLGEATSMAAIAIAATGLAVATFDEHANKPAWLALGVTGLVLGFLARGALFGIAVPSGAIAVAWLAGDRKNRLGAAVAALAGLATIVFAIAIVRAKVGTTPILVGARVIGPAAMRPTFDGSLADLAHAFFPWSALLPFALGALFESRGPLRLVFAAGSLLSFAAHAFTADRIGALPFLGAPFVAGAIALFVDDLELSGVVTLGITALTALFVFDFRELPEKRLLAFATGASGISAPSVLAEPGSITRAGIVVAFGAIGAWLWSKRSQGSLVFATTLFAAAILRFAYAPKLAHALSPRQAFEAFVDRAGPEDEIAVLGVSDRAAIYAGARVQSSFDDSKAAIEWLSEPSRGRRYLVLRSEKLAESNAEYRSRHARENLPVLDARDAAESPTGGSDVALLSVNRLLEGEHNVNPLEAVLVPAAPLHASSIDAEIGGRIRALAWEVVDDDGRTLESVSRFGHFRVRVYYELVSGGAAGHCTFLHIDHSPTRFSSEHTEWKHYPLALWRPGDRIVDEFELRLPAHFEHGDYPVFVGFGLLPCSDDRRLPVTRGASDSDRVRAGLLRVR